MVYICTVPTQERMHASIQAPHSPPIIIIIIIPPTHRSITQHIWCVQWQQHARHVHQKVFTCKYCHTVHESRWISNSFFVHKAACRPNQNWVRQGRKLSIQLQNQMKKEPKIPASIKGMADQSHLGFQIKTAAAILRVPGCQSWYDRIRWTQALPLALVGPQRAIGHGWILEP